MTSVPGRRTTRREQRGRRAVDAGDADRRPANPSPSTGVSARRRPPGRRRRWPPAAGRIRPERWSSHHPQPADVAEERLRRLGVVLDRADPAAERDPDHHRHRPCALGAVGDLRDLGDDLVEAREHEAVELDLGHRPVAAHGQTDCGADDPGFGQWGVQHPVVTEVLLQTVGDAEDPAELADVLAHHDDLRVVVHGRAQAGVQGLRQRGGDRGHRAPPSTRGSSANPAR